MPLIEWSDEYSVQIKEIDAQHKKLAGMINDLHSAMAQGKGKDALGKTLELLSLYVQTHFAAEERLMQQYSYPGYLIHKGEHDAFSKRVSELRNQFQTTSVGLTPGVLTFLRDWFLNHVLKTDKRYSSFFNSRGIR